MKKILFSLFIGGATLFVSCSDLNGNYDELVPSQYDKILSIKATGVQETTMSVEEETHTYGVTVIKGGLHKESEIRAELEIMAQVELDRDYNDKLGTSYQVLPQSMYQIEETTVNIAADETGTTINVSLKPQEIYKSIRSSGHAIKYVVPIRLVSLEDSVITDRSEVLIQCNVIPAVVSFAETTQKLLLDSDEASISKSIVVTKTGNIFTEVRLNTLTQAYVDEHYSNVEGVNYKVLSPDMFKLPTSLKTLDTTSVKDSIDVTFYPEKIYQALLESKGATLVLPIRLETTSELAEVSKNEMLLICGFHTYTLAEVTDKSQWKVIYGTLTYEPWGHTFNKLFDGDTAGGNGWMGYINDSHGGHYGNPYVVIDLGKPYFIGSLGAFSKWDVRAGGANFYITTDEKVDASLSDNDWNILLGYQGEGDAYEELHNRLKTYDKTVNWTKASTIKFTEDGMQWGDLSNAILDEKAKVRYVKMEALPSGNSDRTAIWEFFMKQVTAIDDKPIE